MSRSIPWGKIYKQAFPDLKSIETVPDYTQAQIAGTDSILVLENGRRIKVDEKIRYKDRPDFFLEYWSNVEAQLPGWIAKDLSCDLIAYVFVPSKECYFLPFKGLRQLWIENEELWMARYRSHDVKNKGHGGYTSRGVAVPIMVVLTSLEGSRKIYWN